MRFRLIMLREPSFDVLKLRGKRIRLSGSCTVFELEEPLAKSVALVWELVKKGAARDGFIYLDLQEPEAVKTIEGVLTALAGADSDVA